MEYRSALITGASSGIGKAFASLLAKQNINLILIARREKLLTEIKENIQKTNDIKIKIYSVDLIKNTDTYCKIIKECKPDIIINSAGFGRPGKFSELDWLCHEEMLNVHINAVVKSSYEALKYMIPQKRGLIINVSSLAGLLMGKNYTMYGSTKHFIQDFSLRLSFECKKHNVFVQALCPGFTRTGFHYTEYYPHFDRNKYPDFIWQSAEKVAEESLRKYRKPVCVTGRFNRFIYFLSETYLFRSLISRIMNSSKDR